MLTLKLATEADLEFCETLTRSNMAPYRTARGIAWDSQRFRRSWCEFENFLILDGDCLAGLLRLLEVGEVLEIRDLQLLPRHTGRKIGTWAIRTATAMAGQRGKTKVSLRVFEENPAMRLYTRLGFRPKPCGTDVIEMSLAVLPKIANEA